MDFNYKRFIIVSVILMLVIIAFNTKDYDTEQEDQEQYCEMVRLFRQDKNTGWPDFNENYDQVCVKEKK